VSDESDRKQRAIDSLPDDPDERFDIVASTMFQTLRDAMEELGYADGRMVLMLEAGENQSCLAAGFEEPPEGFAFIMEIATAYAESIGIRMIATRATGPMKEGRG